MLHKDKIGAAVLGVRGYAGKIIEKIFLSGRFNLLWCYHYNREVAHEFGKKYNCKGTNKLEDLLADEKVEAVFIITPNEFHYEQAVLSIKASKHTYIEKPMTANLKEANKLHNLINGKDLVFMVGHNYRRKNCIRKIKQMLDDRILGTPVSLEFINSHGGAFNFSPSHWRANEKTCPGGPLTMLGTHSFDTIEFLLGQAKNVYSITKNLCAPINAADTSSSIIEMKNGAVCYISHNYNVPSCAYLQLHCSEGSVKYELDSNILIYRKGRDSDMVPMPTETIHLKLLDDRLEQIIEFADAILFGKSVETGVKQGWRVVAFVESALQSSKNGIRVAIPPSPF